MFDKHPAMGKKVIVNLFSDNAIEGVLTKKVGPVYIVRAATVHQPGAEPAPADGEIAIDVANVDYIQYF